VLFPQLLSSDRVPLPRYFFSLGLAAFIVEVVQGVSGNVHLPEGYLRDAAAAVRARRGVFIADEVRVVAPICQSFAAASLTRAAHSLCRCKRALAAPARFGVLSKKG
jgi:hypothetical protein